MCGIFGIFIGEGADLPVHMLKNIVGRSFKLSESRGKEAAGIAVKTGESIYVFKEPASSSQLIKSKKYSELFGHILKDEGYTDSNLQTSFAILGHSRLVTNGQSELNSNNQPVIKDGAVGIHNGIIVNDVDLWKSFPTLKRKYEVDTEVFLSLIQMFRSESYSVEGAVKKAFYHIQGSASVAVLFDDINLSLIATNVGSLYTCPSKDGKILIFASEKFILRQLLSNPSLRKLFDASLISQVKAGEGFLIDIASMEKQRFNIDSIDPDELEIRDVSHRPTMRALLNINMISEVGAGDGLLINVSHEKKQSSRLSVDSLGNEIYSMAPSKVDIKDISPDIEAIPPTNDLYKLNKDVKESMMRVWERIYSEETNLKRCTKCILPETMPYISFDDEGVCNYCRNYEDRQKQGYNPLKGEKSLKDLVSSYRSSEGEPDCIVGFSGGRDSAYGLDYIKNVLKLNPIAFTYDWAMVVDLARRNQARICSKLGIEQIVISADIKKKRENIKKNLNAWLKRPELGMIPILMAGDKKFYYYFHKVREQTGAKLFIFCGGHEIEETRFKMGFCGVTHGVKNVHNRLTGLSAINKTKLLSYYAKNFLLNPAYINSSMLDTLDAFYCTYILRDDYLYLYHYLDWDEQKVVSTIIEKFDWETSPYTKATWRIDDGTAAFYNYIYMTMAGITEFDDFRSFQIREGKLSREEAFNLVKEENKPRFEEIEWYAEAIGVDINNVIDVINSAPKLYHF